MNVDPFATLEIYEPQPSLARVSRALGPATKRSGMHRARAAFDILRNERNRAAYRQIAPSMSPAASGVAANRSMRRR